MYNEKNNSLVFSSEIKTKHATDFIENPNVAATIALETKDVDKIEGVQILGKITQPKAEKISRAKKRYLKEFAYAEERELYLWEMKLTFIKMTHNKFGFGKKIIWKK